MLVRILVTCLFLFFPRLAFPEKTAFTPDVFLYVVIPSYNNEKWCIKNLESILSQKYPHWHAIYIDDCSTDATGRKVEAYLAKKKARHKFTIVHNRERRGMLANTYYAVHRALPNWVIVTVDGDDWLAHDNVFGYLASLYEHDPDLWMTYGDYVTHPQKQRSICAEFPQEVIEQNGFRDYKFITPHLRTFRAALFQLIKKADLMHNGKFFPSAGDVCFMIPMLEMASRGHFRYLRDILYIYNIANPIADANNRTLQAQCSRLFRSRPPYTPLQVAPWVQRAKAA